MPAKPKQVMAVANLARNLSEFQGKEAAIYERRVYRVREDSLVEIENEDGADEEKEGMK